LSQNFRNLTEDQELKWYSFIQNSKNDIVFAIEDIDTNLHIGNCALHKINWEKGSCEIGIVIGDKDCWDKGYGSDALRSILNFATNDLDIINIQLNVYKYNHRAIKAYKKCGFKLIKVLKKNHFYNGKYWDTLIMEFRKL